MNTATLIRSDVRFPVGAEIPLPPGMRWVEEGEYIPKGAQYFNRCAQKWQISDIPYNYPETRCQFPQTYIINSSHHAKR